MIEESLWLLPSEPGLGHQANFAPGLGRDGILFRRVREEVETGADHRLRANVSQYNLVIQSTQGELKEVLPA